MKYAIFDNNNNLEKIKEKKEENKKCLEIGKDIQWKIVIRRNYKRLEGEKKENDIWINKNKKIYASGGETLEINPDKMQKGDVIEREYRKEEIKTNENNEFLLKTESELTGEYKTKIIDFAKNNMPTKLIVDDLAKQKIKEIEDEIDVITTLDDIKTYYNNTLSEVLNV
jgi:hypothetical protein